MLNSRFAMMLAVALLMTAAGTEASVYLVGATQYAANSTTGSAILTGYRHTTNIQDSAASAFPIDLDGDALGPVYRDIAFLLSPGDNLFTFDRSTASQSSDGYGLTFYFSDTATPHSAALNTTLPAPHLAAFSALGPTGTHGTPGSGASVDAFGSITTNVAYSGATSYLVDGKTVSVTSYIVEHAGFNSHGPVGSFIIHLTPEPHAAACLLTAAPALLRRSRKSAQAEG